MSTIKKNKLGFLLMGIILCVATFNTIYAQNTDYKKYDVFTDTLLILNNSPLDCERMYLSRKEVYEADTFKINQKGIRIVSFKMTAFGLGQSVELSSNAAIFTNDMRNEIINKKANYKFIYIKDINLQTMDGRVVSPSINTIKIIFNN